MDLTGAVAIVTGAATEMGGAVAATLAGAGVSVVALFDNDAEGLVTVAEVVRAAGARAVPRLVDTADTVEVAHAFADVSAAEGRVDVVCNHPTPIPGAGPLVDASLARVGHVIDAQVTALLEATRLALAVMEGRGGVVVNTVTAESLDPLPSDPVHAAAKAAVVSFTRACAPLAGSHGVRINAVCPGLADPDRAGLAAHPAGGVRVGRPLPLAARLHVDDLVAAVVGLVRDDQRFGEVVTVPNR